MKLSKHVWKDSSHLFSEAGCQGKIEITPEQGRVEVEKVCRRWLGYQGWRSESAAGVPPSKGRPRPQELPLLLPQESIRTAWAWEEWPESQGGGGRGSSSSLVKPEGLSGETLRGKPSSLLRMGHLAPWPSQVTEGKERGTSLCLSSKPLEVDQLHGRDMHPQ